MKVLYLIFCYLFSINYYYQLLYINLKPYQANFCPFSNINPLFYLKIEKFIVKYRILLKNNHLLDYLHQFFKMQLLLKICMYLLFYDSFSKLFIRSIKILISNLLFQIYI